MPDAAELRELDVAVAEACEPNASLPPIPEDAEDVVFAGTAPRSPLGMWYVRCRYGEEDRWEPRCLSASADLALAAYEAMRKRGWLMSRCIQFQAGEWLVDLEFPTREAQGAGDTFAEALSRAIVAAANLEAK